MYSNPYHFHSLQDNQHILEMCIFFSLSTKMVTNSVPYEEI